MSVVLVTGLSGSGKSTALRALEDVGYFCMDNVPVVLLPKVVELADAQESPLRIAAVVDARDPKHLENAGTVIDALKAAGAAVRIVFLRADQEAIIRRYKETRRRHPLGDTGDFPAAIHLESSLLAELEHRADLTLDTSELNVHELKQVIVEQFGSTQAPRMNLKVISFGHKHGPLLQADLLFDVRFLANPHFVPELKAMTGLDEPVRTYLAELAEMDAFLEKTLDLLRFLVPRYATEGKAYLTIGFGCTGGKHRSVAVAEAIAAALADDGWSPRVEHRDRRFWHPDTPSTS